MRNIWILFKREMMAYFYSPIAYIVASCFLLVMGISFCFIIQAINEGPRDASILQFFFNSVFSWIALLVMVPVITMRLFADEKRMGTLEGLMTAPLRDSEYVLAKFLSAYVFYVLLWLPTINCIFVLRHFAKDTTTLDIGSIVGGYVGLFLIGMLFIAAGCLASACTRNQIIAAVITFAICCGLFVAGLLVFYFTGKLKNFVEVFSMLEHLQTMSRGLIEWKRVVFYLSTSAYLLFVTYRIVQSQRWRA
jgi:ABC-2 type transport system permease protein